MIRLTMMLFVALCAGTLAAQATLPITGNVPSENERLFLFDVDFGAGPTSATISVSLTGDNATDGLDVFVGDLDAMAATGFTSTVDQGSDAGTTTVNISVVSASYSGVHQFVVAASTNTGTGVVNVTGTISSAGLASGAITLSQTQLLQDNELPLLKYAFDRAVLCDDSVGTSPIFYEFLVDFGGTAHTATMSMQAEGDVAGDLDLVEVLPNGSLNTLGTASGVTTNWGDEVTGTTTSRSGLVRIRVVADTTNMDFSFSVILPTNALVSAPASFSISGNLGADQTRMHRFSIDFGANPTQFMIQITSDATTGSFQFFGVDIDELASNGPNMAVGSIEPVINTNTYSGVHEFILAVEEDSGSTATYTFGVQVSVAASAVTQLGAQTNNSTAPLYEIFDRGVREDQSTTGAATITREFEVDFGGTTHVTNYWFEMDISDNGSFELFEIDVGGTPVSIDTAGFPTGGGDWTNGASSARTGVVRFRVVVTATTACDYHFVVIFARNVDVSLVGGGGGGGKGGGDDGGCSTGTGASNLLGLLAALALLAVAVRLRRTYYSA